MRGTRLSFGVALAVAAALAVVAGASPAASADAASTYLVLYKGMSVPADAASAIEGAGGALAHSYDRIGVAIARSSSTSFPDQLGNDKKIEGVSNTAGFATQLREEVEVGPAAAIAGPWGDPLSSLQWDMRQIQAPKAHAITGGSAVGAGGRHRYRTLTWITRIRTWHRTSTSRTAIRVVGGVPNQDPAAGSARQPRPRHAHGRDNRRRRQWHRHRGRGAEREDRRNQGRQRRGATSSRRMSSARSCGPAVHEVHVTSNSYFADPWLFNCRNDPEQRITW